MGSVENALRLLLMFRERESVRVSEVAADLGVSRSTAHRLLALLLAYGFVNQDLATRAYGPGPRLVELGLTVARTTDMLGIMHPFLERLRELTDETVHLIVLEGGNCRLTDSVESRDRFGSPGGSVSFTRRMRHQAARRCSQSSMRGSCEASTPSGNFPP